MIGTSGICWRHTVVALGLSVVAGASACELASLKEPIPGGGNQFGTSVAVRDELVVVGALLGDATVDDAGAVHVYTAQQGGLVWVDSIGLADGDAESFFGASVATDGLWIVGGAPDGALDGRVGVFRWDDDTGLVAFETTLQPSAISGDLTRFGQAVAVEGMWLAVGAPGDAIGDGAVEIFRFEDGVGWTFHQRFLADESELDFGAAVALRGGVLVVGRPGNDSDGSESGAATIYRFDESSNLWQFEQTLTGDGVAPFARFGSAVAKSDDRVIVGAPFDDQAGVPSGTAYVFQWDGETWQSEQTLSADDPAAFGFFGGGVALSGNRALVGAELAGPGDAGVVHVFEFDAGLDRWVSVDRREGAAGSRLGRSVALDGVVAAAGAPVTNGVGTASGMASVFVVANDVDRDGVFDLCDNCPLVFNVDQMDANDDSVGDACVVEILACERQRVGASIATPLSRYGHSVDLRGRTAVVGARFGNGGSAASGVAYVLENADGVWMERQLIEAADGAVFDDFGFSVAIDDVIVVGAPTEDSVAPDGGAAYVYRYDEGDEQWQFEQKLVASDGGTFDAFGYDVATHGDMIAVTAPTHDAVGDRSGAVYVYRFDATTGQWIEEDKFVGGDTVARDEFGQSVSADRDVLLIGAWRDDDGGTSSGSAYVFRYIAGAWVEQQKLTTVDAAPFQQFGIAVGVNGNVAVIGAHQTSITISDAGAAHVFAYDPASGLWTETQRLEPSDIGNFYRFGTDVAVHGTNIVVGSQLSNFGADDGGAAYMYAFDGKNWNERTALVHADIVEDEQFGRAVAVDGDWVLVGSRFNELAGAEAGAAFFYTTVGDDGDIDGVQDGCDNCAAMANTDQADCDGNGVGDACVSTGDSNGDASVGLSDFATLVECQTGTLGQTCPSLCVDAFDFDRDGDADLVDFGRFQAVFGGTPDESYIPGE